MLAWVDFIRVAVRFIYNIVVIGESVKQYIRGTKMFLKLRILDFGMVIKKFGLVVFDFGMDRTNTMI